MMRPHKLGGRSWLIGAVVATACGSWGTPSFAKPSGISSPAGRTVLRMARSTDGITFRDTGDGFLLGASAPGLAVMPRGDLLAIFDYSGDDRQGTTLLAVSRSRDGGTTWSPALPIRIAGSKSRKDSARHGDLIVTPDGRLRLYFTTGNGSRRGTSRSDRPLRIQSAVTNNGLNYRVDPRVSETFARHSEVHVTAGRLRGRLHLYVTGLGSTRDGDSTEGSAVRHLISSDGRRFSSLQPVRIETANMIGSVISAGGRLRAYLSAPDGIRSFVSTNGSTWVDQSEGTLLSGWDPAVTQVADGSFLMIYCTQRGASDSPVAQLVTASPVLLRFADRKAEMQRSAMSDGSVDRQDGGQGDAFDPGDSPDGEFASLIDEAEILIESEGWFEGELVDRPYRDGVADESTIVMNDGEAVDEVGEAELAGAVDPADWIGVPGIGIDEWAEADVAGFAPRPDFVSKIDYFDWYRQHALDQSADNAWDYYAKFMPGFHDDPPAESGPWPELNDMFNGPDHDFGTGPWDPKEHPEWAKTSREVQWLLKEFREATLHEGYASPPRTSPNEDYGIMDGEELLLSILLPQLSSHRQLVKATLADAWRLEDGKVNSERMLEAWRTSLRSMNHLRRGPTIIDELVGIAQGALVEKNARWALKHDVFSGEQLREAFDTLREYDRNDRDPTLSLRGEHAFSMDMVQYLFSPPAESGVPQINMKRVESVFSGWGTDEGVIGRISEMTADDAYATIDAFDRHNRALAQLHSIGYPEVRTADIEALEEQNVHVSPLTEEMFPSLSRYYQLKARKKTSRRATQLAYATHLFKEENGRWPSSVHEIPLGGGDDFRIDPFSGDYFGYQLTEDGPRIYSRSENGVDDDGVHSKRWGDAPVDGSDDHVFWPPQ